MLRACPRRVWFWTGLGKISFAKIAFVSTLVNAGSILGSTLKHFDSAESNWPMPPPELALAKSVLSIAWTGSWNRNRIRSMETGGSWEWHIYRGKNGIFGLILVSVGIPPPPFDNRECVCVCVCVCARVWLEWTCRSCDQAVAWSRASGELLTNDFLSPLCLLVQVIN